MHLENSVRNIYVLRPSSSPTLWQSGLNHHLGHPTTECWFESFLTTLFSIYFPANGPREGTDRWWLHCVGPCYQGEGWMALWVLGFVCLSTQSLFFSLSISHTLHTQTDGTMFLNAILAHTIESTRQVRDRDASEDPLESTGIYCSQEWKNKWWDKKKTANLS